MRTRRNVAAAAGRWSARHRWTAVLLWLLFVAGATVLGSALGTGQLTSTELSSGESRQAQETLDAAGFQQPSHEVVLVQSDSTTVADPAFGAAVDAVVSTLKGRPEVLRVMPPLGAGGTGAVSPDQRSALVQFDMKGDGVTAKEQIDPVVAAVGGLRGSHPGLRIEPFGEATFGKAYDDKLHKDYTNAEGLSFPITLAVLIVAFGTLVAAVLPIVLALTAVTAATGLLAVTSQLLHVDANGSSVMTLIGIAVGVDYSLFYIRRFREERHRGRTAQEAVEEAAATSGRAVMISGLAVVIAMAGLFLTRNGIQVGIAEATILVVLVAVVGSVSVLPALLALLGDRVDRAKVPFVHRLRRPARDGRGWDRILRRVTGAPVVSLAVFGGLLVVLSLPAFLLRTSDPGFGDLPTSSMPQLQTYERIQAAFPGSSAPAKIAVSAPDVTAPQVQAGIQATRDAIRNGIRSSAGTVTSAAVVMVAVAGVFGTLPQLSMKEAGVGMCVAVLIDATIIRAVVLPAAMALLGDRTWYLPRFLAWTPQLSQERASSLPAAVPSGGLAEPERPAEPAHQPARV